MAGTRGEELGDAHAEDVVAWTESGGRPDVAAGGRGSAADDVQVRALAADQHGIPAATLPLLHEVVHAADARVVEQHLAEDLELFEGRFKVDLADPDAILVPPAIAGDCLAEQFVVVAAVHTVPHRHLVLTRDGLVGFGDAALGGADAVTTPVDDLGRTHLVAGAHGHARVDEQVRRAHRQAGRQQLLDLCSHLHRMHDTPAADRREAPEGETLRDVVKAHLLAVRERDLVACVATTLEADGQQRLEDLDGPGHDLPLTFVALLGAQDGEQPPSIGVGHDTRTRDQVEQLGLSIVRA